MNAPSFLLTKHKTAALVLLFSIFGPIQATDPLLDDQEAQEAKPVEKSSLVIPKAPAVHALPDIDQALILVLVEKNALFGCWHEFVLSLEGNEQTRNLLIDFLARIMLHKEDYSSPLEAIEAQFFKKLNTDCKKLFVSAINRLDRSAKTLSPEAFDKFLRTVFAQLFSEINKLINKSAIARTPRCSATCTKFFASTKPLLAIGWKEWSLGWLNWKAPVAAFFTAGTVCLGCLTWLICKRVAPVVQRAESVVHEADNVVKEAKDELFRSEALFIGPLKNGEDRPIISAGLVRQAEKAVAEAGAMAKNQVRAISECASTATALSTEICYTLNNQDRRTFVQSYANFVEAQAELNEAERLERVLNFARDEKQLLEEQVTAGVELSLLPTDQQRIRSLKIEKIKTLQETIESTEACAWKFSQGNKRNLLTQITDLAQIYNREFDLFIESEKLGLSRKVQEIAARTKIDIATAWNQMAIALAVCAPNVHSVKDVSENASRVLADLTAITTGFQAANGNFMGALRAAIEGRPVYSMNYLLGNGRGPSLDDIARAQAAQLRAQSLEPGSVVNMLVAQKVIPELIKYAQAQARQVSSSSASAQPPVPAPASPEPVQPVQPPATLNGRFSYIHVAERGVFGQPVQPPTTATASSVSANLSASDEAPTGRYPAPPAQSPPPASPPAQLPPPAAPQSPASLAQASENPSPATVNPKGQRFSWLLQTRLVTNSIAWFQNRRP